MKKIVNVVAAVIKDKDRYFCAQRGDYGPQAKKWEFPGGKIEPGETPQEALRREIAEELKTVISVGDYITTTTEERETIILNMQSYFCTVVKGTLEISEHLDFKWATPNQMEEMDFASLDVPIVAYLNGKTK
jgi:8-oxo-dGTP diphosphatase